MRDVTADSRRGAALVIAIVVVLTILALVVFFLQQSLGYSERATEERVRAESMASVEMGLAMAYHRVRSGYDLQDDDGVPDTPGPTDDRDWHQGWVRGSMDKKDGTPPCEYEVEVWRSRLEGYQGEADSGGFDYLKDDELTKVDRPETWFTGKIFGISTGDLAGVDLTIVAFDKSSGTIYFDAQKYSVLLDDLYHIPGESEYQFTSDGKSNDGSEEGTTRQVETWWWKQDRPIKKYDQRGAVVANGDVEVLGGIQIDGRDHCANGGNKFTKETTCPEVAEHHIMDPGVNGISTTGAVSQSGSSTIGGNGDVPVKSPDGLDYSEQNYPAVIDDNTDNDAQGGVDEDPLNGLDDDRNAAGEIVPDGDRDEDMRYPLNPDEALALEKGTLKGIAQASRTYFTDVKDFNAYVLAQPGKILPGGKIYYLEIPDFSVGQVIADMTGSDDPADDPIDQKPIIFIVHYEDASGNPIAVTKGLFIEMKGIFFTDILDHVNAGTSIVGMLQTFSDNKKANIFGNGGAKIWYSSSVLANLPNNLRAVRWQSSSWQEKP